MDTQKLEIMGRNRLVNELLAGGFEVAEPMRDRGVDLIVYLDVDDDIERFIAFPIQMKAASRRSFSVWRKYDRFPNLIMAYVWGIGGEVEAETYALSQAEVLAIAEVMKWTRTASWIDHGGYSTSNPSVPLLNLLKPYRMIPEKWRTKLLGLL